MVSKAGQSQVRPTQDRYREKLALPSQLIAHYLKHLKYVLLDKDFKGCNYSVLNSSRNDISQTMTQEDMRL